MLDCKATQPRRGAAQTSFGRSAQMRTRSDRLRGGRLSDSRLSCTDSRPACAGEAAAAVRVGYQISCHGEISSRRASVTETHKNSVTLGGRSADDGCPVHRQRRALLVLIAITPRRGAPWAMIPHAAHTRHCACNPRTPPFHTINTSARTSTPAAVAPSAESAHEPPIRTYRAECLLIPPPRPPAASAYFSVYWCSSEMGTGATALTSYEDSCSRMNVSRWSSASCTRTTARHHRTTPPLTRGKARRVRRTQLAAPHLCSTKRNVVQRCGTHPV